MCQWSLGQLLGMVCRWIGGVVSRNVSASLAGLILVQFVAFALFQTSR